MFGSLSLSHCRQSRFSGTSGGLTGLGSSGFSSLRILAHQVDEQQILLLVLLGGVYVEILGDVCFRVTPLTDLNAADMVRSIRGYRLLQGYRGQPPADVESIQDILLRLSRLVEEIAEICEVDLNPIFALSPGQGCQIVDARIHVE